MEIDEEIITKIHENNLMNNNIYQNNKNHVVCKKIIMFRIEVYFKCMNLS
jgi:hypothetical protein